MNARARWLLVAAAPCLVALALWLWPVAARLVSALALELGGGGLLAALVYVFAFVVTSLVAIPGGPAVLLAGFTYGALGGFTLAYLAATVATATTFGVGRYFLRTWLRLRFRRTPFFVVLDRLSDVAGARLVFLLRLSPIVPFSVLSYAASLSRLGFGRFLLASSLGKAPSVLAYSYVGAAARRLGEQVDPGASPWLDALFWGGLAATLVASWRISILARASAERTTAEPPSFEPGA